MRKMGLLSNPSLNQQNKFGRNLAKHKRSLSLLFYFAGIIWFCCLTHSDINHSTYLSENALSPGLVFPEVKQDSARMAHNFMEELRREQSMHGKLVTPHEWILAKMNQMGLETHVHNFTLKYPFGGGQVFHGKNVYGIVRAARIGSTEGIVFSAPYRAPGSVHTDISASVPLLLAFADFARRRNYWAKDIIFLVTEQEQLGMQAWLKAYHEGGAMNADELFLNSGYLESRAGALQAAVNLEVQSLDVDYIDVKLEGLNGQLPNLDMFNLVQRITAREGISSGYKQQIRKKRRSSLKETLKENLTNMLEMVISQASGVPNGNHGIFHRYRIESLTLEAVKRTSTNNRNNNRQLAMLKVLEGISRSLNNLLERFHQSFFFYILVQNDRFVSIGDFMPCVILMAAAMFIKSFLLWISNDDDEGGDDVYTKQEMLPNAQQQIRRPYRVTLIYFCASAAIGVLCKVLSTSELVNSSFSRMGLTTAEIVSLILLSTVVLGALLPLLVLPVSNAVVNILHIGSLIVLGVSITVLGLLNFALGLLVAVFSVPFAILIDTKKSTALRRTLMILYALFLNPFIVIYVVVLLLTLLQYPDLAVSEAMMKGVTATMEAFTFSLIDSLIYANWLYTFVTTILFPQWILFWTLCLSSREHICTREVKMKIN